MRPVAEAREARDVMAFGQEFGRALSDGRIVGRAEPFAKVFPSSRAVKRAVGLFAWAVLEDIALDARVDDAGRLVAETNVRRIAANLGLSKNAVAKYLARLREYGFVLLEERRDEGRYASVRYVLDPSACIERFTHTPASTEPLARADQPCPSSWDTVAVSHVMGHHDVGHNNKEVVVEDPREEQQHAGASVDLDTPDAGVVSAPAAARRRATRDECEATAAPAGPGEDPPAGSRRSANLNPDASGRDLARVGGDSAGPPERPDTIPRRGELLGAGSTPHVRRAADESPLPAAGSSDELAACSVQLLTHLGVDARVASQLVKTNGPAVVATVAGSVPSGVRNPAGWVVAALRRGWECARRPEAGSDRVTTPREVDGDGASADDRDRRRVRDEWAGAVSAALDDEQLADALRRFTSPIPGLERRSVPLARLQLITWAVTTAGTSTTWAELTTALALALAREPAPIASCDLGDGLTGPPAIPASCRAPDLTRRIAARLGLIEPPARPRPEREEPSDEL